MCGIVGYIASKKLSLNESLLAMVHRGPDAKGEYYYQHNQLNVGLGHLRLSIIDLSEAGNQPFHSEDRRYSIIFNGEIYNYASLKTHLVDKGYSFQSGSDTEVLLKMFIEYGADMLNKLNGIFAFCIIDTIANKVFVVRDQLGIKPIYFYYDKELFAFASEIKGLEKIAGVKKTLDKEQLTEFLMSGFLYEPDTGFKEIKKIRPGTYSIINLNDDAVHYEEVVYWEPGKKRVSLVDVETEVRKSINEQTVSDVPVGIFFSGGVDSSIILSELRKKTQAFVVQASADEYKQSGMTSDFDYANKIAGLFDAELKTIKISDDNALSGDDFLKFVEHLAKATEEPIADFTFISSQLLSRETKKLGYTVILSGMGADEIFAGYPRYQMLKFRKAFAVAQIFINLFFSRVKFFRKKKERFNNFLKETDFIYGYSNLIGVFSKNEISEMLVDKPYFERFKNKLENILKNTDTDSDLKKAMKLDLYGFLSHNFSVADKSSMLESQEMRVPLATKELFELGFSLDDDDLVSFKKTKKPLRNILLKELPSSIVNRRKAGFNPPMDNAVKDLGYQKALKFAEDNRLFEIINRPYVENIFESHYKGKNNNTYKIFQLLYLSSWYSVNS
ncbi:asparagine synthase (glutamine-hydrolyzing) [Mucilaginibacter flavidus]|uniref:asparagine synthase (glutamine-hydrolyzing) n=1 Tax=Mucilaginibacter flavidus TaxID=2949309 RepID=UPI002092F3B6|nr:asparagine synthase (glutamine-hydrolyzing) [Mucilaginibacter flavidus]MCO5949301.1 asparagine synthase (glutamine-hydrolyzing) [Mucilaginibacter flavidus]